MRFGIEEIKEYMARCYTLTRYTPHGVENPYVGALVISEERKVVGEGYRTFVDGTLLTIHAERVALNQAGEAAKNGVLFTTLEPCCTNKDKRKHQIFSPCSELIVERGISEVVVGRIDDMFLGRGIQYLKDHGIEVFVTKYIDLSEYFHWVRD